MNREEIDEVIKHRLVLCTGPAFNGAEVLELTYQNDLQFLAFKKVFLATCNRSNQNIRLHEHTVCEDFPIIEREVNCANAVIRSICMAINDPEVIDSDIILFKHETFFARNLDLIRKALGTLVINGYDLVIQNVIQPTSSKDAFSNGVFFIKVSAARAVFNNIPLIKQFPPGHHCESYLTDTFFRQIKLIYKVPWRYESREDRLGFFHIVGRRDSNEWRRDRSDFQFLYSDIHLED